MKRPDFLRPSSVGLVAAIVALLLAPLSCPEADPDAKPVPCVAHYMRLSPREFVGFDNCGTIWKLILPLEGPKPVIGAHAEGQTMSATPECWYLDRANGVYQQVPCPAGNDTIGWIVPKEE